MTTLTSTQVARVVAGTDTPPALTLPKTNAVHVKYSSAGTSISTGDVIQMIALPAWSRVIDGMTVRATAPNDSFVFSVGFTGGTSFHLDSFSTTTGYAIARFNLGLGTILSISEGAALQFDTLDLTVVSTSDCVTCDIHVWVSYTYEPNLRS